MAYATEAHLFITDVHQSPFNVGTRINLQDFTPEEVAELNRRYAAHSATGHPPLRDETDVSRCHALLGGHPYLTNQALYELAAHGLTIDALEAHAARDDGIFADHLRRIWALLSRNSDLLEAVRCALRGEPCGRDSFYHLRAAGVLGGESATEARPRCRLYALYLERQATVDPLISTQNVFLE